MSVGWTQWLASNEWNMAEIMECHFQDQKGCGFYFRGPVMDPWLRGKSDDISRAVLWKGLCGKDWCLQPTASRHLRPVKSHEWVWKQDIMRPSPELSTGPPTPWLQPYEMPWAKGILLSQPGYRAISNLHSCRLVRNAGFQTPSRLVELEVPGGVSNLCLRCPLEDCDARQLGSHCARETGKAGCPGAPCVLEGGGSESRFWGWISWIWILALALTNSVTLVKFP